MDADNSRLKTKTVGLIKREENAGCEMPDRGVGTDNPAEGGDECWWVVGEGKLEKRWGCKGYEDGSGGQRGNGTAGQGSEGVV